MDAAEYDLMDAAEDGMWWYRALRDRVETALRDRVPASGGPEGGRPAGHGPALPAGPWLDVGCGTGGLLRHLRGAFPGQALHGLEYHPPAAARAARKSGAAVAVGDAARLPYPDGAFAVVASMDVLCHAAVDEAAALAEMRRVLAPGGLLVLNLPAFRWLHSAHDRRVHNARRYTAPEARALLAGAGFAGAEARYWNAVLLPLMVAQRKLLARGEGDASDVAPFPPWLDATLRAATVAEARLARLGLRYPAGGSVLATATRPPQDVLPPSGHRPDGTPGRPRP